MKKILIHIIIVITFIIIYLLQAVFFSEFTIAGIMPNIFVIFMLYIGLYMGKENGITYGIIFGIFITISAMAIFPSESSWGAIYSVIGAMASLIGVSRFTKKLSYIKRIICNFGYFIIFIAMLFVIDYIGVININQAPRFCLAKVTGEDVIYYDTLFYDVIRCNKDSSNETYKIIKNSKYNKDFIDNFCK